MNTNIKYMMDNNKGTNILKGRATINTMIKKLAKVINISKQIANMKN